MNRSLALPVALGLSIVLSASCDAEDAVDPGAPASGPAEATTSDAAPAPYEAARALLLDLRHLDDEDHAFTEVYLYPGLLEAGTEIAPLGGPVPPIALGHDVFLAVFDPQPLTTFSHDVTWVLVDASSMEVAEIPAQWPPVIDGVAWMYRTDPADVLSAFWWPPHEEHRVGTVVAGQGQGEDAPKRKAVLVTAGREDWNQADTTTMRELVSKLGFSEDEIHALEPEGVAPSPGQTQQQQDNTFYGALGKCCEDLGAGDKLMLITSGHGQCGAGRFACGFDGDNTLPTTYEDLAKFLRDECKAEFVNVVIPACGSGAAHAAFDEVFEGEDDREVRVLTGTTDPKKNSQHMGPWGNLFLTTLLELACQEGWIAGEEVTREELESFFDGDADITITGDDGETIFEGKRAKRVGDRMKERYEDFLCTWGARRFFYWLKNVKPTGVSFSAHKASEPSAAEREHLDSEPSAEEAAIIQQAKQKWGTAVSTPQFGMAGGCEGDDDCADGGGSGDDQCAYGASDLGWTGGLLGPMFAGGSDELLDAVVCGGNAPVSHSTGDPAMAKPGAGDHTETAWRLAVHAPVDEAISSTLFGPTAYPCGPGALALTLCTESGSAGVDDVDEVAVVVHELKGPVPVSDAAHLYTYAFVFDSDGLAENNYAASPSYPKDFYDGSDRWFEATYSPESGWTLEVSAVEGGDVFAVESRARVLLSGSTLVLVVPADELEVLNPAYRVTAFQHSGDWGMTPPYEWSGDVEPPVDEGLAPFDA